ncbi:unnamed protein product [[Actinomadura] parvosata subsp. kistnae]|uniref:Uncharacterized protein n=1 Tax=[Actinomadura] parvosata subsp. kistnae TaxID=1909395 RepID=A0A1V0ABL9_9ACTN|nr:hypothetical protein [Nonomuraea sp. ATCC 55076]AQZ67618.1 hypothetical protein BKM31_44670 [Nonomuraea sp. ATCC 55076]SPL94098.1 unnamed protein product [Actinomadura parvosata subsp. kistnae]
MSANQLPRPGGGLTHNMSRDHARHDCPNCLRNGGHHVKADEEMLPLWAQPAIKPIGQTSAPTRWKCSYWSARNHEHCGTTEKIRNHPGIGPRCPVHDPNTLNIAYRALILTADKEK